MISKENFDKAYKVWPYTISKELVYEIVQLVPNRTCRGFAFCNIVLMGIDNVKNLTDEEIKTKCIEMPALKLNEEDTISYSYDEVLRAARAIAQKLEGYNQDTFSELYDIHYEILSV